MNSIESVYGSGERGSDYTWTGSTTLDGREVSLAYNYPVLSIPGFESAGPLSVSLYDKEALDVLTRETLEESNKMRPVIATIESDGSIAVSLTFRTKPQDTRLDIDVSLLDGEKIVYSWETQGADGYTVEFTEKSPAGVVTGTGLYRLSVQAIAKEKDGSSTTYNVIYDNVEFQRQ
jgi:hypothetical protein